MTADRGDIYRYLGCRDSQPPAELRQMVEDCLAALEKAVAPRRVYRLYPLDEAVEGTVRFGGLSLESRDPVGSSRRLRNGGAAGRYAGPAGRYPHTPLGEAGNEPGGRPRRLCLGAG